MSTPDLVVAAVAARQYGVFTRSQAVEAGVTRAGVTRRLAAGRWLLVAPGVYTFPGQPPSFRRSLMIAALDAGPVAVVSHESAAYLHRFTSFGPNRFSLVVPHGSTHRNRIALVHQTTRPPVPVAIEGFAVTDAARTIVDLAKVCGPRRLGRVLDDALAEKLVRLDRVRAQWLELNARGRVGMVAVGHLLAERGPGFVPPRSELERAGRAALALVPGPPPRRETDVSGLPRPDQLVDDVYDDEMLIIEWDSRRWHTRVEDFAVDRKRDRAALRRGYRTARYTFEEATKEPVAVAEEVTVLLGRTHLTRAGISSR